MSKLKSKNNTLSPFTGRQHVQYELKIHTMYVGRVCTKVTQWVCGGEMWK